MHSAPAPAKLYAEHGSPAKLYAEPTAARRPNSPLVYTPIKSCSSVPAFPTFPTESAPPAKPVVAGIGLLLKKDPGDHGVLVKVVTPGGAAEADGNIRQGDELLAVDGQGVDGHHLHDVFDMVLGEQGTRVTLTMRRGAVQSGTTLQYGDHQEGEQYEVTLARKFLSDLQREISSQVHHHVERSPPLEPPPGAHSPAPVAQGSYL